MNTINKLYIISIFCFLLTTPLLAIISPPNDYIAMQIREEEKLIEVIRGMTIEFENFDVIQTYINENVGRIHDPENIRRALSNKFLQFFPNSYNDYLRRIEYSGHKESMLLAISSILMGMYSGIFYINKDYSFARNSGLIAAGLFLLSSYIAHSKKPSWVKQKKLLNLIRSF